MERAGPPQAHVGAPVQNTVSVVTVAPHGCPPDLVDASGAPWPCKSPPGGAIDGAAVVLTERAYLDPATKLAPAASKHPPYVLLAVQLP